MIRERLLWSDYQFYNENPSRIDPLKTIRTEAGFGCPNCHIVVKRPTTIEHGQTYTHECGLRMTVYGNSLYCEIEEKFIQSATTANTEWPDSV